MERVTAGWEEALARATKQLDALAAALDAGDLDAAAAVDLSPPAGELPAPGPDVADQLAVLLRRNDELEQRLVAEARRVSAALAAAAANRAFTVSEPRYVDQVC